MALAARIVTGIMRRIRGSGVMALAERPISAANSIGPAAGGHAQGQGGQQGEPGERGGLCHAVHGCFSRGKMSDFWISPGQRLYLGCSQCAAAVGHVPSSCRPCKGMPRAAPSRGQVRLARWIVRLCLPMGRAGRALSCSVQSLAAAASWPVRAASSTAKRARWGSVARSQGGAASAAKWMRTTGRSPGIRRPRTRARVRGTPGPVPAPRRSRSGWRHAPVAGRAQPACQLTGIAHQQARIGEGPVPVAQVDASADNQPPVVPLARVSGELPLQRLQLDRNAAVSCDAHVRMVGAAALRQVARHSAEHAGVRGGRMGGIIWIGWTGHSSASVRAAAGFSWPGAAAVMSGLC